MHQKVQKAYFWIFKHLPLTFLHFPNFSQWTQCNFVIKREHTIFKNCNSEPIIKYLKPSVDYETPIGLCSASTNPLSTNQNSNIIQGKR